MNFEAIGLGFLFGGSQSVPTQTVDGFAPVMEQAINESPPDIVFGPPGPEPPALPVETKEEVQGQLPIADPSVQDFLQTSGRTKLDQPVLVPEIFGLRKDSEVAPEPSEVVGDQSLIDETAIALSGFIPVTPVTNHPVQLVQSASAELNNPAPIAKTSLSSDMVASGSYQGSRQGLDPSLKDNDNDIVVGLPQDQSRIGLSLYENDRVDLLGSSNQLDPVAGKLDQSRSNTAAVLDLPNDSWQPTFVALPMSSEVTDEISSINPLYRRVEPKEATAVPAAPAQTVQVELQDETPKTSRIDLAPKALVAERPAPIKDSSGNAVSDPKSPDLVNHKTEKAERTHPNLDKDDDAQELPQQATANSESSKKEGGSSSHGMPTDRSIFSIGLTESTTKAKLARPASSALTAVESNSIVSQVADRLRMLAAARPRQGVTIHLNPDDLGSITVVVKSIGQQVEAAISATDDRVRTALDENRSGLADAMERHGFRLQSVAVTQTSASSQNSSDYHQPQGHGHSQNLDQQTQQDRPRPHYGRAVVQHQSYVSAPESERPVNLIGTRKVGVDLAI